MSLGINNRDENIDFLKGIAILLVVVGHLIQYILCPEKHTDNIFFRLIYAFHMPLFMFISGYIVGMRKQTIDIFWLKRKAISLMIPFITWIFIMWIIHSDWKEYTLLSYYMRILINPTLGGMWFLCVLFLNCIGLFLATKITKVIHMIINDEKNNIVTIIKNIIAMGIIFIVIKIFNSYKPMLGSELCEWYIRFYFLGVLLGNENMIEKLRNVKNISIITWGVGIFYLFLVVFWQWGGEPLFIKSLNSIIKMDVLVRGIGFLYRHLVPMVGIASAICFTINNKCTDGKNIVSCLGNLTLEIYLVQWYFLVNYTGYRWLDAIISFCLIMQIAFLCRKYISKRRVLGKMLFGKVR